MSMPNFDKNVNIIASLSDEPNSSDGLTADELKAKFDAAVNLIKDYINNTQNVGIDAALALKADKGKPVSNNIQFAAGWANQSATSYYSKDQLGRVFVSISAIAASTMAASAFIKIATLPEGFRPSLSDNYGVAFDISNYGLLAIDILSTGEIKAAPLSGNTSIRTVEGTFMFET